MRTADIAVVGAGLVGLATAHALATTHGRRVVVFEKEPHIAAHQSSHNRGTPCAVRARATHGRPEACPVSGAPAVTGHQRRPHGGAGI